MIPARPRSLAVEFQARASIDRVVSLTKSAKYKQIHRHLGALRGKIKPIVSIHVVVILGLVLALPAG